MHRLPLALDLAGRQLRPASYDWEGPADPDRVSDLLAALGTGGDGDVIAAIYTPLVRRVLDSFGSDRDDAELLLQHIAAHAEAPQPYLLLHPRYLARTDLPFSDQLGPEQLGRILDKLRDGGLISHTSAHTCSMHPMIRETLRMSAHVPAHFRHAAAAVLAEITDPRRHPRPILPADQPRYWPAWQLLLPHLIYLAEHPSPPNPVALTHALAASAHWALTAGDFAIATALYDTAQLIANSLVSDHPARLAVRLQHARLASQRGIHPQQDRQLFEDLLTDQMRVLGANHVDTMTTRHDLAEAIAEGGRLVEARRRFEALLEDQTHILGNDHPDTMTTRHNLAWVVGQTGNLTEARRQYEALLEDRVRVLGTTTQTP